MLAVVESKKQKRSGEKSETEKANEKREKEREITRYRWEERGGRAETASSELLIM